MCKKVNMTRDSLIKCCYVNISLDPDIHNDLFSSKDNKCSYVARTPHTWFKNKTKIFEIQTLCSLIIHVSFKLFVGQLYHASVRNVTIYIAISVLSSDHSHLREVKHVIYKCTYGLRVLMNY